MANNYHVIDGTGANVTFVSLDTGAGIQISQHLPSSPNGAPISNSNPFPVQIVTGLPPSANALGGVTQSGTWTVGIGTGLPTGANVIGNVSISFMPALSTGANTIGSINAIVSGFPVGANVIGTANVGGLASQNTAISGNPILIGATYNAVLPTINSTCLTSLQCDANGRLLTNTAVSVSASVGTIAVSANPSITNNTTNSLYTDLGGRLYVNGSFSATISGGLGTGANSIGVVNVAAITGGLPTGANSIGNVSVTSITLPGLTTGANVIGSVNAVGGAAQNSVPSGGPVLMGGLYLGTQPTVNANCIAQLQMTSHGAQIVATGTDTFNITMNTGLPTGANVIGNVSVSTITLPGLSTSTNSIGNVSVTSITLPGLTTGSNVIGNVSVSSITLPGLTTGTNSIGNVSVTSITLPGLTTGANVIGTANIGGLASQNAAVSGNPILIGATYNAVLPTINSTCLTSLQVDANGRLMINSSSSGYLPTGAPTSTLTRPTNTTAYAATQLIGSNTTNTSVTVSSFTVPGNTPVISALKLWTNVTTGWNGATIQITFYSTAPTYTNGDGGTFAPATGAAGFLGQFVVSMNQFGDGATGRTGLAYGPAIVLPSTTTTVYWDMQILSAVTPISGQVFHLIPETHG